MPTDSELLKLLLKKCGVKKSDLIKEYKNQQLKTEQERKKVFQRVPKQKIKELVDKAERAPKSDKFKYDGRDAFGYNKRQRQHLEKRVKQESKVRELRALLKRTETARDNALARSGDKAAATAVRFGKKAQALKDKLAKAQGEYKRLKKVTKKLGVEYGKGRHNIKMETDEKYKKRYEARLAKKAKKASEQIQKDDGIDWVEVLDLLDQFRASSDSDEQAWIIEQLEAILGGDHYNGMHILSYAFHSYAEKQATAQQIDIDKIYAKD